jgi:hypothetical protein
MLVQLLMLLHRHRRDWRVPAQWGVVMSDPDTDIGREGEELAPGGVERGGAAAGEVGAGGAEVRMEEGVADKDVV